MHCTLSESVLCDVRICEYLCSFKGHSYFIAVFNVHFRDYDRLSKEDVFENNKLVRETHVLLFLIITMY